MALEVAKHGNKRKAATAKDFNNTPVEKKSFVLKKTKIPGSISNHYLCMKYFEMFGLDTKGEILNIEDSSELFSSVLNLEKLNKMIKLLNYFCKSDNNFLHIKSMKWLLKCLKNSKRILWTVSPGKKVYTPTQYCKLHVLNTFPACYLNVISITSNCTSMSKDEIFVKFQILISFHLFLLSKFVKETGQANVLDKEFTAYLNLIKYIIVLQMQKVDYSFKTGLPVANRITEHRPRYLEIIKDIEVPLKYVKFIGSGGNYHPDSSIYYLVYYLLRLICLVGKEIHLNGVNQNAKAKRELEKLRQELLACLIYYGKEDLISVFREIIF